MSLQKNEDCIPDFMLSSEITVFVPFREKMLVGDLNEMVNLRNKITNLLSVLEMEE